MKNNKMEKRAVFLKQRKPLYVYNTALCIKEDFIHFQAF